MKIRKVGQKSCSCLRFLRHKLKDKIKIIFGEVDKVDLIIKCETQQWVYIELRIVSEKGRWKCHGAYDKVFDDVYVDQIHQIYEQINIF